MQVWFSFFWRKKRKNWLHQRKSVFCSRERTKKKRSL